MLKLETLNNCAVTLTMNIIHGKWKPIIIYVLSNKDVRFNDIWSFIPSISKKVLVTCLRELEADGIISREYFEEAPPRSVYSLTCKGQSLIPVFEQIQNWGLLHFDNANLLP